MEYSHKEHRRALGTEWMLSKSTPQLLPSSSFVRPSLSSADTEANDVRTVMCSR